MAIETQAGGAVNSRAGLLIDMIEDFGQFGALPAGGTPTASVRVVNLADAAGALNFPNDAPFSHGAGAGGQTFVLVGGQNVIEMAPLVTLQTEHSIAPGGRLFCLPTSQRAVALPHPGPALRYTLTVPVRRTVAGVRNIGVFASERDNFLGWNDSGFWWICTPGGTWTAQRRTVNGGGLVTVGTSAVVLDTTWRRIGLRYTEGDSPSWDWLIDGGVIFSESGNATVPLHSLTPGRQRYITALNTTAVADPDRFQIGPCRWTVELA